MGFRDKTISEKALNRHIRAVRKLRLLIRLWGGELIQRDTESEFWDTEPGYRDFYGLSRAPFDSNMALDWSGFKIYYALPEQWPAIIHEMGHVFSSSKPPRGVLKSKVSDEFDFFGWEYALSKWIGWPEYWIYSNRDYSVNNGDDFGSLTRESARKLLFKRVKRGRFLGILEGWKPRPVRRGPPHPALPEPGRVFL